MLQQVKTNRPNNKAVIVNCQFDRLKAPGDRPPDMHVWDYFNYKN